MLKGQNIVVDARVLTEQVPFWPKSTFYGMVCLSHPQLP